jgi:hypothetical protein
MQGTKSQHRHKGRYTNGETSSWGSLRGIQLNPNVEKGNFLLEQLHCVGFYQQMQENLEKLFGWDHLFGFASHEIIPQHVAQCSKFLPSISAFDNNMAIPV